MLTLIERISIYGILGIGLGIGILIFLLILNHERRNKK